MVELDLFQPKWFHECKMAGAECEKELEMCICLLWLWGNHVEVCSAMCQVHDCSSLETLLCQEALVKAVVFWKEKFRSSGKVSWIVSVDKAQSGLNVWFRCANIMQSFTTNSLRHWLTLVFPSSWLLEPTDCLWGEAFAIRVGNWPFTVKKAPKKPNQTPNPTNKIKSASLFLFNTLLLVTNSQSHQEMIEGSGTSSFSKE